nr:hypothetical protein BaRGS_017770 [Batillaria attramentaria]
MMMEMRMMVLKSDYAKRKDFAQGVLDFSMFLTSVTQLKILMQMPEEKQDTLWTAILAFVILTMIFQVEELEAKQSNYAKIKDVSQGFLDVTTFVTSTNQLRVLVKTPGELRDNLWDVAVAFVILSMITQVAIIMLLFSIRIMNPQNDAKRLLRSDRLNKAALGLSIFMFLFNALVTGLGNDHFENKIVTT